MLRNDRSYPYRSFSKLSLHVQQHPMVLVDREKLHRLYSRRENHEQAHRDVGL